MTIIGEPVRYGNVVSALDLIMVTPIQDRPSLNNSDIFSVFDEMSPTAFVYSSYCLLLVGTILSVVITFKDSSRSLTRTCNHFLKALWSILETAVDQENYKPIILHVRIVWLFLNFFIFIFVFGYFLNFISVN